MIFEKLSLIKGEQAKEFNFASKTLEGYRKKIDKIDENIIKLIEKRLDYSRRIGEYKKKNGIKIVDLKREKEILDYRTRKSRLSNDFTKKLFSIIIKESRAVQI